MTIINDDAVRGTARRQVSGADPVRSIMAWRPVGVAPEASLRDVARELVDSEIGAVLVETPGGPTGLVSERDLVAALAAGGEPDDGQAADVMTADLVTAAPDDAIAAVGALMRDAGVRHVPILDGHAVVGLVSIRDILAVLLADGARR